MELQSPLKLGFGTLLNKDPWLSNPYTKEELGNAGIFYISIFWCVGHQTYHTNSYILPKWVQDMN